jgi:hypothetical protein
VKALLADAFSALESSRSCFSSSGGKISGGARGVASALVGLSTSVDAMVDVVDEERIKVASDASSWAHGSVDECVIRLRDVDRGLVQVRALDD